jgi:hypothetical protein
MVDEHNDVTMFFDQFVRRALAADLLDFRAVYGDGTLLADLFFYPATEFVSWHIQRARSVAAPKSEAISDVNEQSRAREA